MLAQSMPNTTEQNRRRDMLITPSELRRIAMTRVLAEIRRTPGISRSQLARRINSTDASLSRISKDLIDADMIVEREERRPGASRGRPSIGLHVNPKGFIMLVVVCSSYEQKFTVVSLDGERLIEDELPRPVTDLVYGGARSARAIAREMQARLEARFDASDRPPLALSAAYIATSEPRGARAEAVQTLGAEIRHFFKVPVRQESLTRALHVAEAKHHAESHIERSLLVHAGLDLGASLIIEGGPAGSTLVENVLDQVPIASHGDETTPRWRNVAAASSGLAILHQLGHETPPNDDDARAGLRLGLPHAVRQANAGDPRASAAFSQAGRTLGLALAALTALVAPQRIFLAGPLAQTLPYFEGFSGPIRAAISCDEDQNVQRSRMSYLQAAVASGLEYFVFSHGGGK